jgi:hypothetical protein
MRVDIVVRATFIVPAGCWIRDGWDQEFRVTQKAVHPASSIQRAFNFEFSNAGWMLDDGAG